MQKATNDSLEIAIGLVFPVVLCESNPNDRSIITTDVIYFLPMSDRRSACHR